MCPVCIATAVLIAGSVTSTGGLSAIAIKKFGVKNAADNHASTPNSCLEQERSRRDRFELRLKEIQDVNEHNRETENSVAR
jgi:hypothetical protein